MHRPSTFLPQVFHKQALRCTAGALILAPLMFAGAVRGQAADTAAGFRIFLKDGKNVSCVGEYALVGDRIVFTMAIGGIGAPAQTPFMSLPVSVVDLPRTAAYVASVRRAYYAATRGEADFQAISTDVSLTLELIKTTEDRKQRLDMAIDARRRLLTWSHDNYGYRAVEVRDLAAQFDSVIASLRTQAGESAASLDLVSSDAGDVRVEPLLPPMGLRESIEAALSLAPASDHAADRETLLRSVLAVLDDSALKADPALRLDVMHRLDDELEADREYAEVSTDLLHRADAALEKGDVQAADSLAESLTARERTPGALRASDLRMLADDLAAKIEATRAYRLALDHYALMRPKLLQYERDVRGVMAGLDGLKPILDSIREMSGAPGYHYLDLADARLARLQAELPRIAVPDDLIVRQVQSTLASALAMAREACARHRRVLVADNVEVAREGSAAATAAQMLVAQARVDLIARLYPPHPTPGQS